MHPINGRAQNMEQQNNSQLPWILHRQSQRNESAGSNKLLELFSTMLALWNAICYQPLALIGMMHHCQCEVSYR